MNGMFSIIQVGDVLVSSEVLTERFCCDLEACHGECCVEGDAGAPVTLDEVAAIEDALDEVWPELSASAQAVIDRQGVAYTDVEGTLVTSIVGAGRIRFCKPISCALYPIREVQMSNGTIGLNYHRWDVCREAVRKGREIDLPVYKFLRGPL